MNEQAVETCCPRFDPAPWDEQELRWENRRFVKDRVRSFLRIPLNYGAVMKRNLARIEAAGAMPDPMVWLTDENSPWGADVYIEAAADVPGAEMTTISGTFLSKVFEGPYRNAPKWIEEMKAFVRSRGREIGNIYFFYTTCPKCARKYGKNYVALLARV